MALQRRRPHRRTVGAVLGLVLAMSGVVAGPAAADETTTPTVPSGTADPQSADAAKTAWLQAAHDAEVLNEQVLTAQDQVIAMQAAADQAQVAADATLAEVAAAQIAVDAADAQVAIYQPQLDAFANASLRGVRLSSISSFLTADSPSDYLDQASALDQVAGDTVALLDVAERAKATADAAKAAADTVRAEAQAAADAATAAVAAAQTASDDLVAQQASLQEQIGIYQQLYSSLSVTERGEAVDAFENSYLTPEALARMTEQAAQRAAAGITDADIEVNIDQLTMDAAPDTLAAVAAAAALTRRGLPYVWGAVGPNSFDCSGLTSWAWKQAGITIPRTSAAQAGLPEVPLDQLEVGDLVTFYNPVSHVGMYIGNGLLIHASTTGTPVKVISMDQAGPNPTGHRVPR